MSDRFGNISIQQPSSTSSKPSAKKAPAARRRQGKKASGPKNRVWIWLLILSVLFALYSILGFIGIPYYFTTIFPKSFAEKTGFVFQTKNVSFNPLTFSFTAEDTQIITPGTDKLLKIKNIQGSLAPLSLLRNELVSNSITLQELEASITRELDGSYNFSPLFQSARPGNPAEMMSFSDLPFHFSLNNITVSKGSISFFDSQTKKTHLIEDIQLALPTLSNIPFQADNYIRPHFSATVNGSPLKLSGLAQIGESDNENFSADLSSDLQSFDLPLYLGYLPFDLPFDLSRGIADGKLGLKFSPDGEEGRKLALSFDLKISKAKLASRDHTITISAPQTQLIGTIYPVSKHLKLKTVYLKEPIISSFGNSFQDNISQLFPTKTKTDSLKIPTSASTSTTIDQLLVDAGALKLFKKKSSSKPRTTWDRLQFDLKGYRSMPGTEKKQQTGSFRLTGEQEGTSSFSWYGQLTERNLFAGTININNIKTSTLFDSFNIRPLVSTKGVADLKGRLTLAWPTNDKPYPTYDLKDASISLQNFSLIEKKRAVLSASLVEFTSFSSSKIKTDFGNLAIKNGRITLSKGRLPKAFSLFSSKKYMLQSINYDGQATILTPSEKDLKLSFPVFNLKISNLNRAAKAKNNISIVAKTEKAGELKANGNFQITPFKCSLKVDFSDLPSSTVLPWFTDSPLKKIEGLLDGKGSFSLPKTAFVGQLNIKQGTFVRDNGSALKWQDSILHGLNFSTQPFHLGIAIVELNGLNFNWNIEAKDNTPTENFSNILKQYTPSINKKRLAKNNIRISPVDIQEIFIKDGKIQLTDLRMSPPWRAEITSFTGNITDIHAGKSIRKSQFNFTGVLDDSPFTVDCQSNPFLAEKNGSMTFTLTDFPLADFHEQLGPQIDIDTSKGSFSLEMNSNWEDGQLSSTSNFIFSGVKAENNSSESALPLALIKDTNDTFQLNLSYTEGEPTSGSMLFDRAVARFQKLIVKSSVSPLLLAAGDYTDLIGNEFAEFNPGEFMLTGKGRETLARYSALLIAHPGIGVIISGGYDRDKDATAIQAQLQAIESARVTAENKRRFKQWQAEKEAFNKQLELSRLKMRLAGKIVEQDIPPDQFSDFVPTRPQSPIVDEAILEELADKRAQIVRQYIVTQLALDSARIKIEKRTISSQADENHANGVSIRLTTFGLTTFN